MRKLSVSDMLNGKESRYALCMGVAKRARQIAKKFEDTETIMDEKPVMMAIEELKDKKFSIIETSNAV
jgi:DNA-directed RNA polymerase subunit omega